MSDDLKSDSKFWELVYQSVKSSINNGSDIIILLSHALLIEMGFKCSGVGAENYLTEEEIEASGESIPENWNQEVEDYSLRYVYDKKLYILRAIKNNDLLNVEFIKLSSEISSKFHINLSETVKKLNGTLTEIIPSHSNMISNIKFELSKVELELMFDVVQQKVKATINHHCDNIIICTHCVLINNGFKFVGLERENAKSFDQENNYLPLDWNIESSYRLRYLYKCKMFILSAIKVEQSAFFKVTLLQCDLKKPLDYSVMLNCESQQNSIKRLDFPCKFYPDLLQKCLKILPQQVDEGKKAEVGKSVNSLNLENLIIQHPSSSSLCKEFKCENITRTDFKIDNSFECSDGSITLEEYFKCIHNKLSDSLTKHCDNIIILTHCVLIKNDFKCLGNGTDNGEELTETEIAGANEFLPENWNQESSYSIKYCLNEQLYVLSAPKSEHVINLDFSSHSYPINVVRTVKAIHGPIKLNNNKLLIDILIPTHAEIVTNIKEKLLKQVVVKPIDLLKDNLKTAPTHNVLFENKISENDERPDLEIRSPLCVPLGKKERVKPRFSDDLAESIPFRGGPPNPYNNSNYNLGSKYNDDDF